jgi:hypothetical protein
MKLVLLAEWMKSEPEVVGHLLKREVDRPYARVPIAGEELFLDDGGGWQARIHTVSWDNEGTPFLFLGRFDGDEETLDALKETGFQEVSDTSQIPFFEPGKNDGSR